ncbi:MULTISPECIES: D-glycero-alpha-D-manno-heptose-1,7-bisphosphate 7-phosphatase [Mycetohabitans]|uniref:D-glycero-alpha-D-manno-heptose-1,7-bisphosphate 7-phosphatase n=1 Tax=Mycetohabitans TaxID=2571159 RepID=UPI001F477044|nr:HAD-IIIA family hydrolase [Mycetohabitans sp. B3]MCF2132771.1 HAD-IIIA family hydrolase [Mycetohabitans sp. B3]
MAVTRGASRGAVLLDKDGTLLKNVPYNVDPARMVLAPSAAQALRRLGALGMPLAVVSNQPGVALGCFPEAALCTVRERLCALFREHGAVLAGFFYCPHHPSGAVAHYAIECDCRKPRSALLTQALAFLDAAPQYSWMVGDILDDIEAGRGAGCRTILVDCGNETEWQHGPQREPDFVVERLDAAAHIIAAQCNGTPVERIGQEAAT